MGPLVNSSHSGNSSNNSASCHRESLHICIPALMCLVCLLGFLLNTFSLWVFYCRLPCWTSGITLQFHLAVSDAVATPVIPLTAVQFAMGDTWHFGRFLCQLKIALLSSHFFGSAMFLTLISIHRYAAVVRYNQSSCMKQKEFVRKLCAGVWSVILMQALVYTFTLTNNFENNQCLSIHQKKLTNSYYIINFILFIFGFLIPFLVSAVCYGRLANSLTRINISTANGLRVKEKSQRMISVCLLIFGLCFLPVNIIRTIGVVTSKFFPGQCHILLRVETAYYVSWIFVGVNSCLDPLLYCFGSKYFRDAIQSLRVVQRERPNRSDSENTADL